MKNFLIFPFLVLCFGLTAQTSAPSFIQIESSKFENPTPNKLTLDFSIDQDAFVNQCIGMVEESNIANTIITLENYGTRFHAKPSGVQASHDIKDRWQTMVSEALRNDVTVEEFSHSFTNQVSVILTIPGSESPEEIIVIGGHLDCGDYWLQNDAPGADDNASGIATLTETLRILLANNFHPKKTVQIMGYAAEEIGLYGSADIAQTYKDQNKNVLAVLQFDMTNYKGSNFDIALNNDAAYTSAELNLFLIDLLEHYNSSGEHLITYGSSKCNYACSDHASWAEKGFHAGFPMEAKFEESNPNIHTPNDTFAAMGDDASHSVKFVKLALEFVIETAKTSNLKTVEVTKDKLNVAVEKKKLVYQFEGDTDKLVSASIFDPAAKKLIELHLTAQQGEISLNTLPVGAYIVVFKDKSGKVYSKKFLLK